jgi:hypothetical protein
VWLTRNDFVFKRQDWTDVKLVLRRVLVLTMEWKPICKPWKMEEMKNWCSFLETGSGSPCRSPALEESDQEGCADAGREGPGCGQCLISGM